MTIAVTAIVYYVYLLRNLRISSWLLYTIIVSSIYIPVSQFFKCSSLHFYVDFSHWLQIVYNISISGKPISLNQDVLVPGTINYLTAHFVPSFFTF